MLILAPYPHPDIGALREALLSRPYFQTEVVVSSTGQSLTPNKRYDVALLYDAYAEERLLNDYLELQKKGTACWWIISTRSQQQYMPTESHNFPLHYTEDNESYIEVTPVPYVQRPLFESYLPFVSRSNSYPPVQIPSFRLQLLVGLTPLLQQKIGDTPTHYPLWIAGTTDRERVAFSIGTNFWKWRLQEAAVYDSASFFDEIVVGTVQYLSTSPDKRRLRVYPVKEVFSDYEQIVFRTEVYDDGFLPRYGSTIGLSLRRDSSWQKHFTYIYNSKGSLFRLEPLPSGTYYYTATLKEEHQKLQSKGTFYVEKSSAEVERLQADFPLLRRMSSNSGGTFFEWKKVNALLSHLQKLPILPYRYRSTEKHVLIAFAWLLPFFLSLLVGEWALRKYMGGI